MSYVACRLLSYAAWYKMRFEALGVTEAMTRRAQPSPFFRKHTTIITIIIMIIIMITIMMIMIRPTGVQR